MERINYDITPTWMEDIDQERLNVVINFLDEKWTLSIVAAITYGVLIFGGRRLMENHKRFRLTYALVAWNAALAIFSTLGAIRMIPNLHYALTHQSFHDSVCTTHWTEVPVLRIWIVLFSLSKIVELGDTAFIVLRKQPLILLHWYHHMTVLIYTWFSFTERTSSGRWYIAMNYLVHSAMYMYYAARALRFRPPEWLKMGITIFQLSQMVVGVYIAVYVYQVKAVGIECGVSTRNMRLSFLMYFSYFLLFMSFFYEAYIKARPTSKTNGIDKSAYMSTEHSNENLKNGTSEDGSAKVSTITPRSLNGEATHEHSKGHLPRSKKEQ